MKEIYLDNAAATPITPHVSREMLKALRWYGNPSSFNDAGRAAAQKLAEARRTVATFLNARPDEIVFCASGSEANTLALSGAVAVHGKRGSILTTPIEHRSVLCTAERLAETGHQTVMIPVDGQGLVRAEDVGALLRPSVAVVSVMYANNEIGTIEPIARIGQVISRWRRAHRSRYPLFHVDACQAATSLSMDVQHLGADLLTFNGAKAYGPHGIAVLFVRRGTAVRSTVPGGAQEGGRRAGTEDVVSAVGLATALKDMKPQGVVTIQRLRDRLIGGILASVPDTRLNGPQGERRLAGNVNISIAGCESERMLLELDAQGIRAGSGSACTAHSVEPSHVLRAIRTPKEYLGGALRFSLGRDTTRREVDAVVRVLPKIVERIRRGRKPALQ